MTPDLPENWRRSALADVVELQRGFDLPAHSRVPGPYPVLTSGEVGGWHNEGPIEGPGFVVGRATNLGKPKWSSEPFWPHNTTMFAKDFRGNNPRWLFHLFEATDLSGFDSGSVQPMLNRNYIAQVPVVVPPLAEQRAIVEVLGALDEKIVANTALATTADELVRAEYAALEGDVVRVGEIAGSPRSSVDPTRVDPDALYVGLEHLERRHMWLSRGGRAMDVSSAKSQFEAGDVLFGKLRPYFHKVVGAPQPGICSTDILVARPRDERLSSVLLASLSSDAVIDEVVARSEGTRMPRTSWKDLAAVEIRWPRADTAPLIAARLDSVRQAALAAVAENRTLAATRDALLPQLMSGKLRVRDAEAAASEAGA